MASVAEPALSVWLPVIAAVIALELIADVIAKEFALHGGGWRMGLAVGFVIAGNVTWQLMLRSGVGLARAGLVFAVGVALGATLIGVFGYGEGFTARQVAGSVLAVVVVLLLA